MIVETPPEFKTVEDYDIESITGNSLSVIIDASIGDTISFTDTTIDIYLASRQSRIDPANVSPPETTSVNRAHVFAVRRRERKVPNLNPEQQAEWSRTFQEMGGKIH